METYISELLYTKAMDFNKNEIYDNFFLHAISGLKRLDLINIPLYGRKAFIERHLNIIVPKSGFIISPTQMGMELYLWANGKGELSFHQF